MGDEGSVVVEAQGATRVLRLNRPGKLNALDPATSARCRDFFREAAVDPEVRVVVLTGTGSRAFSSGFDLDAMVPGVGEGDVSVGGLTKDVQFPKPVIAAVNGLAYGGGFELVLACDLRVAVPTATFALPEVRHGLIAGGGGTVRLPRQLPWAVAAEVLMLGRVLDAAEALRLGLLNAVVEPGELLPTALAWAEELAQRSPLALEFTKASMWRGLGMDVLSALELEQRYSELAQQSDEAARAVAEFRRRRNRA